MSYILNYSNWRRLFEATDPNASISDVRTITGFAGATVSVTTNASALEEFKAGLTSYTVQGEISETTALIKIVATGGGKTISNWKIGPKTQTAKDYLKIGDVILNGDSKKPVTITVTPNDWLTKSVEASGNGIYALGRALVLKTTAGLNNDSKIVIGLNAKTANSFVANANTAFQTPVADFTQGARYTFIIAKAVTPNANNTTNAVSVPRDLSKKTDADASKWANSTAMPQVPKEYNESLKEVSKIDATAFVETIKNKNITSYTTDLDKLVTTYVDTFFESFLTAYAERFKSFLTKKATEAGISSTLFQDLFTYIDEWKTAQIGQKATYKTDIVDDMKSIFSVAADRGSVSAPAASAAGKVIKGTEGKIGQ